MGLYLGLARCKGLKRSLTLFDLTMKAFLLLRNFVVLSIRIGVRLASPPIDVIEGGHQFWVHLSRCCRHLVSPSPVVMVCSIPLLRARTQTYQIKRVSPIMKIIAGTPTPLTRQRSPLACLK